jgi:hypothetical protein
MEEREEESQFVYDKDRLHDPTPLEQLRLAV